MNITQEKIDNQIKTESKEIVEIQPKKERKIFWDIVKGIGIISIVLGHTAASPELMAFVYLYHLAIFYFSSAYFYNEKKYGDKPYEHLGQRIKSMWPKYVFYAGILIVLHNFFVRYNFYSPTTNIIYSLGDIIRGFVNTIMLNCEETFAGALWFVPTLIVALGLFGGIIYIARNFSKIICSKVMKNKEKVQTYVKYSIILILTIISGIVGIYLNLNKIHIIYHIHTVFLILPICTLGYFAKINIEKIQKLNKIYITIPVLIASTVFLIYAVKQGMRISLAQEDIINSYMFYIVSTIGICFCCSLSNIMEKIPILNKTIAAMGKHSFSIMALHFACAKGIDVIYSKIIGETNPEIISKWVTAYPEKLWIIYLIVGCVIPVIFSILIDYIKSVKLIKRENKNNS